MEVSHFDLTAILFQWKPINAVAIKVDLRFTPVHTVGRQDADSPFCT